MHGNGSVREPEDGAASALDIPNVATCYLAWTVLNKMQGAAKPALAKLAANSNSRHRARALGLPTATPMRTSAAWPFASPADIR